LQTNSFVVYFDGTLVTTTNSGNAPLTGAGGASLNIGKIGFGTASGGTIDYSFSDIYAADTAPGVFIIESPATATAQAGYPFLYQIQTSGGTATSYSASNLPTYLSLNSTNGVISGTVPINVTPGLLPTVALGAIGTTTASANLNITVTAPPSVEPTITSPDTASGNLTRAFSYQITTQTTSPSSSPTSYAIASGTLPAGLALNTTTGAITGTPTATGTTVITYTATNPFGTSYAKTLSITIDPAPAFTWNNTSSVWTNANSWTNGAVPANSATTDIAAFGNLGPTGTIVDVGVVGRSIGGIVFNPGAYAYNWTGSNITVGSGGGIANNSTAIQTFSNKVINNGANPTWSSVSGGGIVFSGGIDLTHSAAGRTLTFAGAGNFTISGTISNGGTATNCGLTFSGTGSNLLSGSNSYGGVTKINSNSILKLGNPDALGSTNGNTDVSSEGALDLNGQAIVNEPLKLAGTGIGFGGALINTASGNASWGGTVALVNSATYINASAGKNITISGVISGSGKGIYKLGAGTLELSATNTSTGTNQVAEGVMALTGVNSATGYIVAARADNISPVLRVSGTNAMSPLASLNGASGLLRAGTLDLSAPGDYVLNQFVGNNISLTNSSGSASSLTFTNTNHTFSSGGGRTLANQSADLTVTFLGQLDIAGDTNVNCTIAAIGPVVISNRVYNSNTNFTRGLTKSETGTLTINGINNYNGPTTVSKGVLSIPASGSLVDCGITFVRGSGSAGSNSASLNLAGAAGVVEVSTNGFVRGGGSISSLQVQDSGTVEVALGSTWITGGSVDFATNSKVSIVGTPASGQNYTLMTASNPITGVPTLATSISGYQLSVSGNNLLLQQNVPAPSGLSYTPPAVTGTVGTAISNLAPTITGTVTNYSISPELPAGLSISSSTGVISGTPTDVASTATYTITASNSGGDTTTTISVTVNSAGAIFDTAYPGRSLSEVAPNGLTYLMNYAFGGSYSNAPKLPVQDVTDRSKLTLIAYVRTNDSGVGGVLSVKGQTNNGLSNWSTNSFGPSSIPTDQSDAPIGTQKQIFSVSNSGDRLFLRLKVTK
jgi:autotransporter-associated beta strand protein